MNTNVNVFGISLIVRLSMVRLRSSCNNITKNKENYIFRYQIELRQYNTYLTPKFASRMSPGCVRTNFWSYIHGIYIYTIHLCVTRRKIYIIKYIL